VKAHKRILLYGNSLILGTIGGSLRRLSQFEVTTLATPLQEVREFDDVNPDIILFDLETTHTESVFSMLETNPTLLLIGISPDINLVKIWSGRQLRDISTQGFLDLIKSEIKDLSVDACSDENRPYRSVEKK